MVDSGMKMLIAGAQGRLYGLPEPAQTGYQSARPVADGRPSARRHFYR